MSVCQCVKEKDIEMIKQQIHEIQLKDVEKEKDIERFQESIDKLNSTLDELKAMIEAINNKPIKQYENALNVIIGGILGATVAFIMSQILGGV